MKQTKIFITGNIYFYRQDYGFLGLRLQQAVIRARNAPPPLPTSSMSNEKLNIPSSSQNSL